MSDVQGDIYAFGYKLAMAALNPGWTPDPLDPESLPPIPVIQDQQDQSAPTTGRYVAVQGSPAIDPVGANPYTESLDANDSRGYVQPYTGTLIFWEVNGNGSLLATIKESLSLESMETLLSSQDVTFLDSGTIDDVSFKLDNAWKMQSRMTVSVSLASRITETLNRVKTIDVTTTESTQ